MEQDLKQAIEVLRRGGVILYPTDTVWGLGCDATDPRAVARIFEIKKRAEAKSMLVLVGSVAQLERIVPEIPDAAWQLLDVAVSPLTIVYDHVKGIAPALRAADGSTGVRVTAESFSRALCLRFGRPIVSTSANFSGTPAPANFSGIDPELAAMADYVVRYRRDDNSHPSPSGIIKCGAGNVIQVIR